MEEEAPAGVDAAAKETEASGLEVNAVDAEPAKLDVAFWLADLPMRSPVQWRRRPDQIVAPQVPVMGGRTIVTATNSQTVRTDAQNTFLRSMRYKASNQTAVPKKRKAAAPVATPITGTESWFLASMPVLY
jgi:hypothetical protein